MSWRRPLGFVLRLALVGLIAGCSSSASTTQASPRGSSPQGRVDGNAHAAAAAPLLDALLAAPAAPLPPAAPTVPDPSATPAASPATAGPVPTASSTPDSAAAYYEGRRPVLPRRFVVLGDSLSAWVVQGCCAQHTTSGTWPQLLAARDPSLILGFNAAVPGNTTAQMLARMERDVFAYSPDVLFIMGGTNDLAYDVPDSTIVDNIRLMLEAAKARGIAVVLLTDPPNNAGSSSLLYHYVIMRDALRGLAAREGVALVDVYAALATPSGGLNTQYAAPDRLHLNAAGQQAISDAAYAALNPAG